MNFLFELIYIFQFIDSTQSQGRERAIARLIRFNITRFLLDLALEKAATQARTSYKFTYLKMGVPAFFRWLCARNP